jgi:hypothetical protein
LYVFSPANLSTNLLAISTSSGLAAGYNTNFETVTRTLLAFWLDEHWGAYYNTAQGNPVNMKVCKWGGGNVRIVLVQWNALKPDNNGFIHLSIAEFSL